MWTLFDHSEDLRLGGILGDDMGLGKSHILPSTWCTCKFQISLFSLMLANDVPGKTVQIVTFLTGLFNAKQITKALVVVPLSLIQQWTNEFKIWGSNLVKLRVFQGNKVSFCSNFFLFW
jgi:SNF2 family DNA or RNA helicase